MTKSDVIAALPAGLSSTDVAIAASRAGARGFVRLDAGRSSAEWCESIERVTRFTSNPFGVLVDGVCALRISEICDSGGSQLQWVWLEGGITAISSSTIARLRELGLEVIISLTDQREFEIAVRLGVEHIILKGNEAGGRTGETTMLVLVQQWHRFCRARDQVDVGLPQAWAQGGIGPHTAAACRLAGVDGLVLDSQLLLARETCLTAAERRFVESFDGSQSRYLGGNWGLVTGSLSNLGRDGATSWERGKTAWRPVAGHARRYSENGPVNS